MKFSSTPNTSVQRCIYLLLQDRRPPFSAAPFFQRISQSPDQCTVGFGRSTLDYGSQTPDAESSVQSLASNTCVQSPGILVCLLYMQPPPPHHLTEQHFLFHVKSENIKFFEEHLNT